MIPSLVTFCILALVLLIVWKVIGRFFSPDIMSIVGLILGLILLIAALKIFGIWSGISLG